MQCSKCNTIGSDGDVELVGLYNLYTTQLCMSCHNEFYAHIYHTPIMLDIVITKEYLDNKKYLTKQEFAELAQCRHTIHDYCHEWITGEKYNFDIKGD